MDGHVFFPDISSMLLHIECSELLQYSSMFLQLSLNHFSLASSHFFSDFLQQRFVLFRLFFLLASFIFHKVQNILSHASLFSFPFESWYFFHCCFLELCPLFVYFFSFSLDLKFILNCHTILFTKDLVGFE